MHLCGTSEQQDELIFTKVSFDLLLGFSCFLKSLPFTQSHALSCILSHYISHFSDKGIHK